MVEKELQSITARQEIVQEQQSLKAITNELRGLLTQTEKNFLRIGKLLYEVRHGELYIQEGYSDMWSWFRENFNFEVRTAQMLMRIWAYFGVGRAILIPEQTLAEVGYVKSYLLTMLYDCGKLDSSNLKDWIEIAKENSTREFQSIVRENCGRHDEDKEKWVSVSLRIPPDGLERFEEIINAVAENEGIRPDEVKKKRGELVLRILEDWYGYFYDVLYAQDIDKEEKRNLKIKKVIDQLEGAFKVKVAVFDEDGTRIY